MSNMESVNPKNYHASMALSHEEEDYHIMKIKKVTRHAIRTVMAAAGSLLDHTWRFSSISPTINGRAADRNYRDLNTLIEQSP